MAVKTWRINDDKHQQPRQLAASRHTSVNRLFDELATIAIVQHHPAVQYLLQKSRVALPKIRIPLAFPADL